jgi:transcriptional regulator with XRE-family HTH domain
MEKLKDVIRSNLKKYRLQSGMTQIELASQIGVRSSAISNWEKGQNSIDIDTLFKICKILKVPIDSMIESQNDVDYVIGTSENDLILETYKKLPEAEKAHLLAYAEFLYNQSKLQKN